MNRPILRTTTHGYVVENFLGPCKITGEVYPVITKGGMPAIFPDEESIPPKWRKYKRAASTEEVARGYLMPRVVNVQNTFDEQGKLIGQEQIKDPYKATE